MHARQADGQAIAIDAGRCALETGVKGPQARVERASAARSAREHLAEHHLQDPAVAVRLDLGGLVDARDCAEARLGPVVAASHDVDLLPRPDAVREPGDREGLGSGQAERLGALTGVVLPWPHAHADQVATVDALEALGQHRADAQERRPLRGPVA
jgi:hypothetical protein